MGASKYPLHIDSLLQLKSGSEMKFEHKTLNEDGYPKFVTFDVKIGYISSSSIVICAEYLLRYAKGVHYGNAERLKAADFMLKKTLLTNIYQYTEFIAVFCTRKQTGFHARTKQSMRKFQMKLHCVARNYPTIISLPL